MFEPYESSYRKNTAVAVYKISGVAIVVCRSVGTASVEFHTEPAQLRIKYKIGKVIGEGNFATVKECTEK